MKTCKPNVDCHFSTFTHHPKVATPTAGFSLIEIMVVLVVFALVATLTVPSIRDYIQNNQMSAKANSLIGSLALARSEAIKRNTQVSVCASSTQTGCSGANWNNGWIVFVDGATPGVVDGTDQILNVVQGLPGGMELASTDPFIQFNPNGSLVAYQPHLLDIGKHKLASLFERMRGWGAQTLYMLLPGKMACADEEDRDSHDNADEEDSDNHDNDDDEDSDNHDNDDNHHGDGDGHGHPGDTDSAATPIITAGAEMVLCNSQRVKETGRLLVISASGQVRMSRYNCN